MKILFLDIETSPCIGMFWGLFNQNISINQIIEPSRVLCFAAKFQGERKVHFLSEFHHSREEMVREAHRLMSESDAIITYNGPAFDIPHLNREIDQLGLRPPSPSKQVDLYRVVKRNFKFPSNKLEYVAPALGVGKKVKNPGMDMWRGCLENDSKSWAQMRKYCIGDVAPLLEDLYDRLLPWISNHPNHGVYEGKEDLCPNCGSMELLKEGFDYTSTGKYQRFSCRTCGKWSKSGKRIEGVDVRGT